MSLASGGSVADEPAHWSKLMAHGERKRTLGGLGEELSAETHGWAAATTRALDAVGGSLGQRQRWTAPAME